MSGNQKQTATVGPQQTQRYQGTYTPRPPTPQRTETFHVSTPQSYVPQQPQAQPGGQGPLRTIGPAGPPNQSTTPPNTELKVQQMPQQASVGITFVPQTAQVRGSQSYYRNPAPTSQTQRMTTNHRQGQQTPMYQTQPTTFLPLQQTIQPVYIGANMQYYNSGARQSPGYVQPSPYHMISGQQIAPYHPPFAASQNHQPQGPYFYTQPTVSMARPGPATPVPAGAPNPVQPTAPTMPLIANTQQHPPQRQQKQRRKHALAVVDPVTGEDRLNEVFEDNSHPASGESSARQTPHPPAPPNTSKEVQATFAKQVAQAICNDENSETTIDYHHHHPHHGPPMVEHIVEQQQQQQPQQQQQQQHPVVYQHNSPQAVNSSYESIVQSSKLQAQTKEFIPANQNIDKETPVVSAITDAVEVTISNKQLKDRESPVKSRKQREQTPKEQSQPVVITKEPSLPPQPVVVEKPPVANKEDVKHKENVPQTIATGPVSKENKEVANLNQKDENRRNQRKEKGEQKGAPPPTPSPNVAIAQEVPLDNSSSSNGSSAPQSPAPIQDSSAATGKSKQNASQRNKDGGKQQPPQQQQQQQQSQPIQKQQAQQPQQQQPQPQPQPTVPVPQSQPPKSSSKTSKMKEINTKGASKEGTDMDAFNDNTSIATDVANANVPAASITTNDNFNVNPVIVNANNANAVPATPNIVVTNNKRTETNDVITKTEAKPLPVPKGKVDVTAIVRDSPKTVKTFVVPETTDETDHMATAASDKLVQVKNEVNAKSSKENVDTSNIIKERSHLPYKKDQWSPFNPDGKKVYDAEFLLALRNDPKSNRKPDIVHSDLYRAICVKSNTGSRTDFAPAFGNSFMGKSSSAHQPPPKRNSQTKMGGSGNKGNKQNIRVSISVREDVKLHETENAWKPARFHVGQSMTEDEKKTEELYRKVRGVLNKLTPQKFETLITQVKDLTIDTKDRLQGVIDLVFEKAVDEPNFSHGYAVMCKQLAMMQVPTASENKKKDGEFVNFRKLLITRCQLEFERNSIDETKRNTMVKEIDECTDSEKRKELQVNLEEYDRRIRMKSVGNIRFIGELFKQGMLTANIMMKCLYDLIDKKDEERLECLCKLLTTVGKELEKKDNLDPIFVRMKEIVDKKHGKVSSRIRFMLQDVIDLRRSKWVPRRQDSNPKTIDQIQKEAETEQLNIQAMNAVTPRKDERGGSSGPSSDRKNRRNVSNEEGWSTATSSRSRGGPTFVVQSDKLKNKMPQMDEPLGSSSSFSVWSKGSNVKTSVPTTTANIYAALDNISADTDKRLMSAGNRSSGKEQYISKGPSMERTYKQYNEEGRGSRSGSQHRSNDSSNSSVTGPSSLRGSPAPTAPPTVATQAALAPTKPAPVIVDEEQLERRLKNILEEYLNECCTVEECDQDIRESLPPTALPQLVSNGYIDILERSKTARLQSGLLFATLIKRGTLPLQDYCSGLEEVLAQVDDLIIDIPKIWDYLAEILLHPVCEEALSLRTLYKCCEILIAQNHAGNLLKVLFRLIIKEKGPNFLQNLWQASGLKFSDFLPSEDAAKFVKDNEFQFLLGEGGARQGQSELTYEQIHEKLLQLFNAKASFDEVFNWINANVGERVKDKRFIRTLATAIFENSIVRNKLNGDTLKGHYSLIHRFVDNNPEYELQCLYALQALINKLEHPQGILLAICSKLYEDGVFPQDSFIQWELCDDPAEREGKGVALKQLTSFFTQLKENDEEESSASDEA